MSGTPATLLLVRDGPARAVARELLLAVLGGVRLLTADAPLVFAELLADEELGLVVVGDGLGWTSHAEIVELLGRRRPPVPTVLWLSEASNDAVIAGFRAGAADVVVGGADRVVELRDAVLRHLGGGGRGPAADLLGVLGRARVPAFWQEPGGGARLTPALTELLGGEPEDADLLGALLPADLREAVADQLQGSGRALVEGVPRPGASGRRLTLRLAAEGGAVLGVVDDVTDREHLAQELSEARYAADAARSEAMGHRQELAKANTRITELRVQLDGLAHDLAEPLHSADARLLRLAQSLEKSGSSEAIATIQGLREQLGGLAELARRQLDGEGTDPIRKARELGLRDPPTSDDEVARVGQVLEQVKANLQEAIAASGATVHGEELPTVAMPPTELLQVLQNLVHNAIRHHDSPNPEVRVRACRVGSRWEITVEDDGPGIPEEAVERVFQPRWRGPGSDGTGVGLAVCRAIVARHGGEIRVESGRARGAAVTFTVPVADPAVAPQGAGILGGNARLPEAPDDPDRLGHLDREDLPDVSESMDTERLPTLELVPEAPDVSPDRQRKRR